MKTALVTGGSSGIGRSTAAALKNAGFAVYEFSRRNVPQDGIKHISVDVTDENAVQKAVGEILSEAGKLDVVVNCAGFGISGAVEFTPLDQAKAQFEVNFFGTVNVNISSTSALWQRSHIFRSRHSTPPAKRRFPRTPARWTMR